MTAGAVVVSLCSTNNEAIEEAEKDLPRNLCPLIKSSYGFGKTDKCPYFYFSDLVVGETTCDGYRRFIAVRARFSRRWCNSPEGGVALRHLNHKPCCFEAVQYKVQQPDHGL
ncbi:2-hydroxyglutaryl-CoA dehydratase, D-component [Kosakonia oryziphila]|jgi:Benzoyl-CoA reductase/2-hydroxyglutaryl-CoA dehydratase subunit, BcrC/BadD/HgdB|uniref:2-hydroxyglutaryl-CoA dehydratase, D-component n=1 Tax=Kosakonia oryziphila TaxID=1005667 RepID=A0A1C3YTM9_9ENTR|nr:2-hydroxyglutaryl-CoA dehydratase, D-component [Kosakonia oryziphila]